MADFTSVSFGEEFCEWLRTQKEYADSTVVSRLNNVARIENVYGSLPEHWARDNFDEILHDLEYSDRSSKKAGYPFGEIGKKSLLSLHALSRQMKRKSSYSADDIKNLIINPLKLILESELGPIGYKFHTELQADNPVKSRDRYDLIGLPDSEGDPVVVFEFDTHRSDQLSKKVVSRVALNSEKPMLYVAVLYSNDHENKAGEKKECEKYIGYVRELFSIMTKPQKSFLPYRLYHT